jgi:hypothetical protein
MALNTSLDVIRFTLYSTRISLQLSASAPGHHLFALAFVWIRLGNRALYQAYKAKRNCDGDVDIRAPALINSPVKATQGLLWLPPPLCTKCHVQSSSIPLSKQCLSLIIYM